MDFLANVLLMLVQPCRGRDIAGRIMPPWLCDDFWRQSRGFLSCLPYLDFIFLIFAFLFHEKKNNCDSVQSSRWHIHMMLACVHTRNMHIINCVVASAVFVSRFDFIQAHFFSLIKSITARFNHACWKEECPYRTPFRISFTKFWPHNVS